MIRATRQGFTPINSVDVQPKRCPGLDPECHSADDVALHLEWLACGDSRQATTQAACDQVIRSAKAEQAKKLVLSIDGRDVSWADYRAKLVESIEKFSRDETARAELFEDGKKTREFTFGSISFRTRPKSIDLRANETPDSVLRTVEALSGIVSRIVEVLATLTLFGHPLRNYVRSKLELNKQGIQQAWKAGDLTDAEVRELGFKTVGGDEAFSIDVGQYLVQSERRAAPAA